MNKIRVIIVEDHQFLMEATEMVLNMEPDIEVVGKAYDGRAGVSKAEEMLPDVMVLDVLLPRLNGYSVAKLLAKKAPSIKILVVTGLCDISTVSRFMKLGVKGYLTKASSMADLVSAIRHIHSGNSFYDPATKVMVDRYLAREIQSSDDIVDKLTPRQLEVLQLIAEGQTNRIISEMLSISPSTVGKHRQYLMDRVGTRHVAGLTRFAVESMLVDPKCLC